MGSTGTADHLADELAELSATQDSAIAALQATFTALQTRVAALEKE